MMMHKSTHTYWAVLFSLLLGNAAPAEDAFKVVVSYDFEDGQVPAAVSGTVSNTKTYQESKFALKSAHLKDNEWFSERSDFRSLREGEKKGEGFTLAANTTLSFAYYTTSKAGIKIQVSNTTQKTSMIYLIEKPVLNTWTPITLNMLKEFATQTKKKTFFKTGDKFSHLTFLSGSKGTAPFDFYLDNYSITEGGVPGAIADEIKKAAARIKAALADPETDYYFSDLDTLLALREKIKPAAVTPKTWMALGGGNMTSRTFAKSLRAKKKYTMTPPSLSAKKRQKAADAAKKIKKNLAKAKPEVVFIMLGAGDIQKATADTVFTLYLDRVITGTLEFGAVPVLINVPRVWKTKKRKEENELVADYNKIIAAAAKKHGLVWINAHGLIEAQERPKKLYAKSMTQFNKKGDALLAATIAACYEKLEKHVLRPPPSQ